MNNEVVYETRHRVIARYYLLLINFVLLYYVRLLFIITLLEQKINK